MRRIAIVLGALLFGLPASAEDHLEPYDPNPEYQGIIESALNEAYDRDVVARVLVLQSFEQPDWVAGLKLQGGSYRIFALHPSIWLWNYTKIGMEQMKQLEPKLAAAMPADYHNVPIARCDYPIGSKLGGKLVSIWKSMLLGTREFENRSGDADGTAYSFSMRLNDRDLVGMASNPEGGVAGDMAEIAMTMDEVCVGKAAKSLRKLNEETDRLLAQLNSRDKAK